MNGMKIALVVALSLSIIAIGVWVYLANREPVDYDTHTIVNHMEDYANWDGTTIPTYMDSLHW